MNDNLLEKYIALDISDLVKHRKDNRIAVTAIFSQQELSFKVRLELEKLTGTINQQSILLDKTKCNYGSYRYWFLCPECKKRCKILYFKKELLCRKCAGLTYASQQRTKTECYYYYRKAIDLATTLDTEYEEQKDFFQHPYRFPEKPAGMRYKTYLIKRKEFNELVDKGNKVWLAYVKYRYTN